MYARVKMIWYLVEMLILSIAKTKHSILKIIQPDSPVISLSEPFVEPSSIISRLTISVPDFLPK